MPYIKYVENSLIVRGGGEGSSNPPGDDTQGPGPVLEKRVEATEEIWEARVSRSYHFTFQIEDGYYLLRRVGTHDTLDNP